VNIISRWTSFKWHWHWTTFL